MRSVVESLGDRLLGLVVPEVTAHAQTCNSYGCGICVWGIRIQLRRLCCCTSTGCSCSACIPVRC
jgi:hypothetical protein